MRALFRTRPIKTHLQLNVAELGNFNALRVATEDYVRSRRIFKTHDEDSMEVDAVSRKEKGNEKSGKGKKGFTEKRQQNTHDSMVNVETEESTDTKLLIVGTSSRTNLKVNARARESRHPK